MLVSPDNLASKLHDGLKPLYLIYGEETLTKLEAADAIRASARKAGYSEREYFVVEAHFDWSLVTQSSDNLSLFATRRIVEIAHDFGIPVEAELGKIPDAGQQVKILEAGLLKEFQVDGEPAVADSGE